MSSSLRDQLLEAGLVTKEQVQKSEQKKKPQRKHKPKTNNNKPQATKKKNPKSQQSDLAKFYQQRSSQERKEKQEAEKKKQEDAKLKKERRQKARKLIHEHKLDHVNAEIRYNFVVGTTVKYIFVTKEQQQQLEEEKLAITFHGGNRYLIPTDIGKQLREIDPDKIIIF